MRFDLSIPYNLKDELKKEGIKWDMKNKTWFIEKDEIPEKLQKYVSMDIFVDFDEKDIYKQTFRSMSWNPLIKKWKVSKEDFEKIMKLRE